MIYFFKLHTKKNKFILFYSIPIFLFTLILILNFAGPLEVFSSQPDSKTIIASGVVPHHLLAKPMIDNFFQYISSFGKVKNLILLSPDHFQSALINHDRSLITLDRKTNENGFCELPSNILLLDKLLENNLVTCNSSAIYYDHGIMNLLPFIEKYLTEANILPILIPEDISREQIEQLVRTIDKNTSSSTVMVASVDFSHYLPGNAAAFHDTKSIRTLLNFEKDSFKNSEVDCWQALYAIRFFTKLRDCETPCMIEHNYADDFLDFDTEKTTSYFSLVYKNKKSQGINTHSVVPEHARDVKTLLFTGDIMLDRGVKELMQVNSLYYPFLNIHQFLRGVDIVSGNLEGPIVNEPPYFSRQSLRFAFGFDALETLSSAGFNLLSLANNHTLDMGINGFNETIEHLDEYHIHSTGNPFNLKSSEHGNCFIFDDIIFAAFNRILPFKKKDTEILKTIKHLQTSHPEKLITISMHWGNEYRENCSRAQKQLAHRMIDAGADLIIGHHPHVVQNIESYRDKLIFYSLGNFVFDQSFSSETQEGLAVGLEVYPEQLIFRLFPIKIDLCQPALMNHLDAQKFLSKLAKRSDVQLVDDIESGIMVIKRR